MYFNLAGNSGSRRGWRRLPHPAYEYMRDADGDGVVCE